MNIRRAEPPPDHHAWAAPPPDAASDADAACAHAVHHLHLLTQDPVDLDALFANAARCRDRAVEARAAGHREATSALFITGARLVHHACSASVALGQTYGHRIRELIIALTTLGGVRELPADDAAHWRARLAEVAAALFVPLSHYPFAAREQVDALLAIGYAARAVAQHAPHDPAAAIQPLALAGNYPGSPTRVAARLAHLELVGQQPAAAHARLTAVLAAPPDLTAIDDVLLALVLGLATARAAQDAVRHAAWLARIAALIGDDRAAMRSFEGRLSALQPRIHQLSRALQPLPIGILHHPDDVLAIAEATKARCLLDDLAGHAAPASTPAPRPAAAAPGISLAPSPLRDAPGIDPAAAATAARHHAVERQRATLSYWSLDPTAGAFAGDPAIGGSMRAVLDDHAAGIAATDATRAAERGGYTGAATPATADQLRAALADDELLIELLIPRHPLAPNRACWTLVVHRGGSHAEACALLDAPASQRITTAGLVERGPLSEVAAAARAAILEGDDATARRHLGWLFEQLLQPVIDAGFAPEAYRRWILVAHGPLHLVPLHALVDADGRHLIERVAVVIAPSASVWCELARRDATATRPDAHVRRVLAVGDPAFGGRAGQLPHTRAEVDALAGLLPWCPAPTVLAGAAATRAAVTAALPAADVVHIATHGALDPRDPRDGHALLLADGDLRAADVRALALPDLALVVLDACNAVVCRYGAGDEPLGLLAAFLAAGARNVIGGLWELRDADALAHALRLYAALADGDPAAAVRTAARAALAAGVPLHAWAGIALAGAGRPLAVTAGAAASPPTPRTP